MRARPSHVNPSTRTPEPGRRFEAMIRNLFGISADGRTDRRGGLSLLQAALLAREVDDTIRFTSHYEWF